jgi:hypothetical protein
VVRAKLDYLLAFLHLAMAKTKKCCEILFPRTKCEQLWCE